MYNNVQPCTTIYNHIQPYTTIYYHIQPYTTICNHMQPYTTICNNMKPCATELLKVVLMSDCNSSNVCQIVLYNYKMLISVSNFHIIFFSICIAFFSINPSRLSHRKVKSQCKSSLSSVVRSNQGDSSPCHKHQGHHLFHFQEQQT